MLQCPLESHMALGSKKPYLFTNTLRGACCTICLQCRYLHITLKSWENKPSHFLSFFRQWSVSGRRVEESQFWWLQLCFSLAGWLHGNGPSEMLLPASLARRPSVNPSQGLCGSEYCCFPDGHLHAASLSAQIALNYKTFTLLSHNYYFKVVKLFKVVKTFLHKIYCCTLKFHILWLLPPSDSARLLVGSSN